MESLLLEMRNIHKSFPGVQALKGVSFDVRPGEVHALVGENGAGKSTLIKILAGAYQMDGGEIRMRGSRVHVRTPRDARNLGVAVIYQEFNLVPHLSAPENIFLGQMPRSGLGFVEWSAMREEARRLLAALDIAVDLRAPVRRFSVAQQQVIEIARALAVKAEVIVMDEPTATLTRHEIDKLFEIIARLRDRGVAVIYISHRLDEIQQIADRVTVLRDGERIGTLERAHLDLDQVVRMMVGRDLDQHFPHVTVAPGPEVLRVEGLTRRGVFRDISFGLRRGEILGIAGLVGARRTEVGRCIFGAEPPDAGRIWVRGEEVRIRSPHEAVRLGIGLLPEERKAQGLVLLLSVKHNMSLTVLERFTRFDFIRKQQEAALCHDLVQRLDVRTPGLDQLTKNLSGGNQQKVVLAKWLARDCDVLICDEPTRGIDVGAKVEIYKLLNQLKERGAGIVMISSELPEVLGMSDRILVMRAGGIVAELGREEAAPEVVLSHALGGAA